MQGLQQAVLSAFVNSLGQNWRLFISKMASANQTKNKLTEFLLDVLLNVIGQRKIMRYFQISHVDIRRSLRRSIKLANAPISGLPNSWSRPFKFKALVNCRTNDLIHSHYYLTKSRHFSSSHLAWKSTNTKTLFFWNIFCFAGMYNYFYYFTYSIYTITLYRSVKIFKFSRK